MKNDFYKIYLRLTLAQMFWAGAFVAGQLALINQPPVFTAFIRNGLSTLGFILVLFCFKKGKTKAPSKSTFLSLMWMGFFGVFLYTILVYCGLKKTTAISASLLIPTTQPLFTVLLSKLIYREPLKISQIVGLSFGFIGAICVMSGSWALKPSLDDMIGNILMLGGALAFSIYSLFGKAVLKELEPLETVTYSTLIGSLLLFPLAIILDKSVFDFKTIEPTFWICMSYMVIFAGILPYLWWYSGVKILGASKTASITFLLPPFALFLAVIILHQRVSTFQIIGGCLGLLGVAFATGFIDNIKQEGGYKKIFNLNFKYKLPGGKN